MISREVATCTSSSIYSGHICTRLSHGLPKVQPWFIKTKWWVGKCDLNAVAETLIRCFTIIHDAFRPQLTLWLPETRWRNCGANRHRVETLLFMLWWTPSLWLVFTNDVYSSWFVLRWKSFRSDHFILVVMEIVIKL